MTAGRATIASITILLGGCVTNISPQTAAGLPTPNLCMQFGHWLRKDNPQAVRTVSDEIERRSIQAPTSQEYDWIRRERVTIGLSECAMLAAMGSPDRQNDTLTAEGRRTQYVFNRFAGRPG